jgi:hypothetical protein
MTDNGSTVGISQSSLDAAAKLDINGRIRIAGGNPGKGKVLYCDSATGLASWQNVANPNIGFSVKFSGTTTYTIPSGSFIKMHFLTEDFDDGNGFSDSVYVVPENGVYQINAQATWDVFTSNAGVSVLGLYINGTAYTQTITANSDVSYVTDDLNTIAKLTKGDVLTFQVLQNSGNAEDLIFTSNNRVSAVKLY